MPDYFGKYVYENYILKSDGKVDEELDTITINKREYKIHRKYGSNHSGYMRVYFKNRDKFSDSDKNLIVKDIFEKRLINSSIIRNTIKFIYTGEWQRIDSPFSNLTDYYKVADVLLVDKLKVIIKNNIRDFLNKATHFDAFQLKYIQYLLKTRSVKKKTAYYEIEELDGKIIRTLDWKSLRKKVEEWKIAISNQNGLIAPQYSQSQNAFNAIRVLTKNSSDFIKKYCQSSMEDTYTLTEFYTDIISWVRKNMFEYSTNKLVVCTIIDTYMDNRANMHKYVEFLYEIFEIE